ncbi:hypothetical protein [Prochlorococcus marinus]|nr:hypothetical protein [Prochlorococcus marinus]
MKVFLVNIYRFFCIGFPILLVAGSRDIFPQYKIFSLAEFDRLDEERGKVEKSFEDSNKPGMPSGPLELMNVLRRATAMDGATSPSDALDEAIQAFENADKEDTALPLN